MDSATFYELINQDRRREAAAFFKEASGFADTARSLASRTTKLLRQHAPEIAGALVGAAALSAVQYQAFKPGKSGTSAEQRAIAAAQEAHDRSVKEMKAEGKEPGFASDLAGATIAGVKPFADLGTKYPGKAALMMAPLGAATGATLAKILFR